LLLQGKVHTLLSHSFINILFLAASSLFSPLLLSQALQTGPARNKDFLTIWTLCFFGSTPQEQPTIAHSLIVIAKILSNWEQSIGVPEKANISLQLRKYLNE
jgi:hypothetical protein